MEQPERGGEQRRPDARQGVETSYNSSNVHPEKKSYQGGCRVHITRSLTENTSFREGCYLPYARPTPERLQSLEVLWARVEVNSFW